MTNQCIFTGLPTDNKWKNTYVHPDFISLARDLVSDPTCPANTIKDAFIVLADHLEKDIKNQILSADKNNLNRR